MSTFLPQGVESYWKNNLWDRRIFESSELGSKYFHQRELTLDAINKYKPRKVLVLCCGVGLEVKDISQLDFVTEVIAMDINPVSCQKTREISDPKKVTVLNANIYTIRYDRVFDAVVCMDALQHLGDQKLLLPRIHRALKPEGIFIGDYCSKELFKSWMLRKHNAFKVWRIHTKHQVAKFLLKSHLLPGMLVKRGWMRAYLLTAGEVNNLLRESDFKIVKLISDEWHFFIAKKI